MGHFKLGSEQTFVEVRVLEQRAIVIVPVRIRTHRRLFFGKRFRVPQDEQYETDETNFLTMAGVKGEFVTDA